MENLSRRAFTQSMLGSLFTFSLVNTLCKGEMLIGHIKPVVKQWLIKMEQVTKALREGNVKPVEWQLLRLMLGTMNVSQMSLSI